MSVCFVNAVVGLKQDVPIEVPDLRLYEFNGVHFPLNNYYNADELPIEWLEIVES